MCVFVCLKHTLTGDFLLELDKGLGVVDEHRLNFFLYPLLHSEAKLVQTLPQLCVYFFSRFFVFLGSETGPDSASTACV